MGNGTAQKRRRGNKTPLRMDNGTAVHAPETVECGNKTRMPFANGSAADGDKKDRGIAAAALLNHELIQP